MIFPPPEIALKVSLALGVGLLVGLEREWSHKEVGVRTFALTALLGMLSSLVSTGMAMICIGGIVLLAGLLNVRAMMADRSLETTTSVALFVTAILGVMVGQGHFFTPVSSAIVMTMLLAWKEPLSQFATHLRPQEIRSAVLLGLVGFVIYPLFPNRFTDPWQLFNPREAWVTVIFVAGISFVNYVLLRLFGARGLYYMAGLGGLVNSTATAGELAEALARAGGDFLQMTVPVVLLTVIAMFARNMMILGALAPSALPTALAPTLVMALLTVLIAWRGSGKQLGSGAELSLTSPIQFRSVFSFAILFLAIQMMGTLAERYLGQLGFYGVSLVGGLVSSAGTTAAAANMVMRGKLDPGAAGVAAVLASMASTLVNLPVVYRVVRERNIVRRLSFISAGLVAAGAVVLLLLRWH